MFSKKLTYEIVSPEGTLHSSEADSIVAPGLDGKFEILPNHIPIVSSLKEGKLKIKNGGKEEIFTISTGYLEFRENKVIILTDTFKPTSS